jgi:hypothetical protein
MVYTSVRLPMFIDNGNGIGSFNRLTFNANTPNNSRQVLNKKSTIRRLRMDLNTSMIGRIEGARAGCGSCGGG